ncbi:MAG: hypothetical protein JO176_01685, partial [Acidimicrobiia bacterium]|nr:hypothetical protein [Acidimicrobiia bacterium]
MNESRPGSAVGEGDVGPERGIHRRALAADGATADHDETLQRAVKLTGFLGVEDVGMVEGFSRRMERTGPGGDQREVGLQLCVMPPSAPRTSTTLSARSEPAPYSTSILWRARLSD